MAAAHSMYASYNKGEHQAVRLGNWQVCKQEPGRAGGRFLVRVHARCVLHRIQWLEALAAHAAPAAVSCL